MVSRPRPAVLLVSNPVNGRVSAATSGGDVIVVPRTSASTSSGTESNVMVVGVVVGVVAGVDVVEDEVVEDEVVEEDDVEDDDVEDDDVEDDDVEELVELVVGGAQRQNVTWESPAGIASSPD
jgi:hypothetical protein